MKIALHLLIVIYIWYLAALSQASDCPLHDFCVAVNDPMPPVFVNGRACKDPNMVTADDFFFSGLNKPGNYDNTLGHRVTRVYVGQLPGLNTLGISLIRIDIAPYGLDPPHTHPRASEVLHVFEGTLYVGFVTSNVGGKYRLFTKILYAGDVFVFPQGLIHFEYNIGNTNAVVFGSLSSQNPGFINIAKDIFGSDPPIDRDVLIKAFQLDEKVIKYLQDRFSSGDI